MSKNKEGRKNTEKTPEKNLKQKRAAKEAKRLEKYKKIEVQ